MKLMLTSFGIDQSILESGDGDSIFRRMPPVSFRRISESFMPNYELLLLCDRIVMDGSSFEHLIDSPLAAYSEVASTFKALNSEGRVELVDFVSILRANSTLLDRMLQHDMKLLDQWVVPLRESLDMWRTFAMDSRELMHQMVQEDREEDDAQQRDDHETADQRRHAYALFMHSIRHDMHRAMSEAMHVSYVLDDALNSPEKRKRKEYRSTLREVLQSYLTYVNANLVLSSEFGIGFHDWLDFTPFYSLKFLSVGKAEDGTEEARQQLEKLFTIAFPELAIRGTKALLRALNDKRVEDLRRMVDNAVRGEVQFDERFAKEVLFDVFRRERQVRKARSIIGYLTMPVGFIPWVGTPVQKLLEETVGTPIERKIKSENRWFYMLSEIADSNS